MPQWSRAQLDVIVRWAGVASVVCLAALSATYYLTYEPAPAIKVRWREGLPVERRVELERQYLLVNPAEDPPAWTWYDLLDTRRKNIAALVRDSDVTDTTDIDRENMTVPFHVEYGHAWMWVAHRTPGLRKPWAQRVLIGGLAEVALLAALLEVRRRRRHGLV